MIKLTIKLILLSLLSVVLFELFSMFIISHRKLYSLLSSMQGNIAVIDTVDASRQKIHQRNVIVGDSVAGQLSKKIHTDNSWVSLTSVQGISMAGQYLLLSNLIKNNNLDNIVLIYHPRSLMNDLNQPHTYVNFVRNFYNEEYYHLLTGETKYKIESKFFSALYFTSLSKVSTLFCLINYRDNNYVQFLTVAEVKPYISNTSAQYLKLIYKLCIDHNIKLTAILPPISERDAKYIYIIQQQAITDGMEHILKDYFSNIVVIKETYLSDAIHYSVKYNKEIEHLANDKILPILVNIAIPKAKGP